MVLQTRTPFSDYRKAKNRMFAGSFLDRGTAVREESRILEETNVLIDLSTDCSTERTIFDILSTLGFDLQMCGTKYIISILVQCVINKYLPVKTGEFYQMVSAKFDATPKTIEIAVIRAIESVKLHNLLEANRIFNCLMFHRDAEISAGMFLNCICGRLIMLKSHATGEVYFG